MASFHLFSGEPGKPAGPRQFEVSPVEHTHPWWGYLWPFRTRKTLVWTLCLLTGGSLASTAVVLLWLDPGALPWGLIGGLIGGMSMGPYRVLPAKLTITTRSEARDHVKNITQLMLRRGYVVDKPSGEAGHVQYCPKSRDRWPWLYWSEQDADLRWRDHQIELHGPVNLMEWLNFHLLKQLEA